MIPPNGIPEAFWPPGSFQEPVQRTGETVDVAGAGGQDSETVGGMVSTLKVRVAGV